MNICGTNLDKYIFEYIKNIFVTIVEGKVLIFVSRILL
jgi:hypothetical protein